MPVLLAEELFELIQTAVPEALVEAQPLVGAGERAGFEVAEMSAAAHLATDQPGVFQRLDVLRSGSKRDREGFRKLPDRLRATGEFVKHPSTRGVAQGVKNRIHLTCI